jgi:hypothetical protein
MTAQAERMAASLNSFLFLALMAPRHALRHADGLSPCWILRASLCADRVTRRLTLREHWPVVSDECEQRDGGEKLRHQHLPSLGTPLGLCGLSGDLLCIEIIRPGVLAPGYLNISTMIMMAGKRPVITNATTANRKSNSPMRKSCIHGEATAPLAGDLDCQPRGARGYPAPIRQFTLSVC